MSKMFHDSDAPVQPEQLSVEFGALIDIYVKRQPMTVVEIGSYRGGSLYQWIKHATPGARIVAVDMPGGPWGDPEGRKPDVDLWQQWAGDRCSVYYVEGNSADPRTVAAVMGLVGENGVDFLFIDGDHRYPMARSDFEQYGRLVSADGLIVLHDILEAGYGVIRLWQEIKQRGCRTVELTSYEGQRGMGIGIVLPAVQTQEDSNT